MSLLSRSRGHLARITEKFRTSKESQCLPDEEDDEEGLIIPWIEQDPGLRVMIQEWQRPKQLPISAETVFLQQIREVPKRFFRKTRESITIEDAWDRLSFSKREGYAAKAKKNEIYNTARLAKLNERCPLSPSVVDLSLSGRPPMPGTVTFIQPSAFPRRIALQRWKRYRSDHPRACGGPKTPMPQRPFRIMDLPFELRREIFSLVLSCSGPVLQFQSDGSADELPGPVDVRLFAVSRQVSAEAVKIFYEANTFSICTKPSSYRKAMPLFVRLGTESEAPRPIDLIKRVQVNFRFLKGNSTDTEEFRFLWKKFSEFLKTCKNLRTVEVWVRWVQQGYMDGAIDLQVDKLAKILMDIESTMGANFSDTTTRKPCEYGSSVFPNMTLLERRIVGVIPRLNVAISTQ